MPVGRRVESWNPMNVERTHTRMEGDTDGDVTICKPNYTIVNTKYENMKYRKLLRARAVNRRGNGKIQVEFRIPRNTSTTHSEVVEFTELTEPQFVFVTTNVIFVFGTVMSSRELVDLLLFYSII